MVGSVEQISQQLVALDKQVAEIGEKFHHTYFSYLTALGQAVRQQLILSCYQVCTESYPQQFLQLSLSQRQQFQQSVRDLANQAQAELLAQLQPIGTASTVDINDSSEEDLGADDEESDDAFDDSALESDGALEGYQNELDFLLSAPSVSKPVQPLTPIDALVRWQENLEKAIAKKLQTTSHAANLLLHQSKILPKQLPEPILKAVAKAGGDDPIAGNANLLKLLVEAADEKISGQGKSEKGASLLHLVAIQLRLSEIEFNDSTAMAWRNKLRDLKKQFQTLGRDYQKKYRERAIAQAQDTWRSTWTND